MTENQENLSWPPELTAQERQELRMSSVPHQLLVAQAYGAEIILSSPGVRDNQLAQLVDRKTGLGMDVTRVAVS